MTVTVTPIEEVRFDRTTQACQLAQGAQQLLELVRHRFTGDDFYTYDLVIYRDNETIAFLGMTQRQLRDLGTVLFWLGENVGA